MTSAGLHADDTFTATVRSLVPDVRVLLAGVLMTFQNALGAMVTFTRVQCRPGGAFVPIRLALFRHGKSFRGI
jgi:hypothetical protein